MRRLLKLFRVKQWYKNGLVFLGIVFSGNLFDTSSWIPVLLAFFLLCFASSANYIVNDIRDRKRDAHHPEKRLRPIACGDVHPVVAAVLCCVLVGSSVFGSLLLPPGFLAVTLLVLATGGAYNLHLKNVAFADVIALSVIYVWRAAGGCFVVNVQLSEWLILTVFLFAMFWVLCKRKADLDVLKPGDENNHKKVYDQYSRELIDKLTTVFAAILILAYFMWTMFSDTGDGALVYSIPFFVYLVMQYLYLVYSKSKIARRPELIVTDRGFVAGALVWAAVLFWAIYLH